MWRLCKVKLEVISRNGIQIISTEENTVAYSNYYRASKHSVAVWVLFCLLLLLLYCCSSATRYFYVVHIYERHDHHQQSRFAVYVNNKDQFKKKRKYFKSVVQKEKLRRNAPFSLLIFQVFVWCYGLNKYSRSVYRHKQVRIMFFVCGLLNVSKSL